MVSFLFSSSFLLTLHQACTDGLLGVSADYEVCAGRPDTMKLLKDTWESFGAEVIFITSNMSGNDEMMQGCRQAGLHAFGTLWDF